VTIEANYVDSSHATTRTARTTLVPTGQLFIRPFADRIDEVFVTLLDASVDATDYVDTLRSGVTISTGVGGGTDSEVLVMTETGPATSTFTAVIPVQVRVMRVAKCVAHSCCCQDTALHMLIFVSTSRNKIMILRFLPDTFSCYMDFGFETSIS
jgi:hypothetical protein